MNKPQCYQGIEILSADTPVLGGNALKDELSDIGAGEVFHRFTAVGVDPRLEGMAGIREHLKAVEAEYRRLGNLGVRVANHEWRLYKMSNNPANPSNEVQAWAFQHGHGGGEEYAEFALKGTELLPRGHLLVAKTIKERLKPKYTDDDEILVVGATVAYLVDCVKKPSGYSLGDFDGNQFGVTVDDEVVYLDTEPIFTVTPSEDDVRFAEEYLERLLGGS